MYILTEALQNFISVYAASTLKVQTQISLEKLNHMVYFDPNMHHMHELASSISTHSFWNGIQINLRTPQVVHNTVSNKDIGIPFYKALTLCILIAYSFWLDTINLGWYI